MTRSRLEELGIVLPILPTTNVGSLPRTDSLAEIRREAARGRATPDMVEAAEREAVAFWIKKQEEIGLDVLTDGEQLSGDRLQQTTASLEGFEEGGRVRLHGNRYARRPIIVSGVRWKGPYSVERWAYAQSITSKPVKAILPGPCTIADWSFSDYYPDVGTICHAVAEALGSEIEALIERGARMIQLDEPVLAYRPDLLSAAIETYERMTNGRAAYFILHICTGRFDPLYPEILRLSVDNIDLELAHGRTDVPEVVRRDPFTKDVGVGIIDSQNRRIEDFRNVRDRIRRASALFPTEAMWVDPDCGLKGRTVDEAIAKLRVMVEAARSVREESLRKA